MAKLVSGYSYLKVSNFVVNSISANGSNGSSGQYLTSNGTSSYWSTFSLNTAAQYTFTNTISFSNTVTIDNNKNLNFKTVNTSATVSFVQQSDDNFVMYSTNTAYGQKAIWSVYANSITSNLQIQVPLQLNAGLVANGGLGSAGQVLTSNGTTTYWSTVSGGAGSVNTAAQYTWTNLHTFSANVAFTGNGIGLTTNTAAIYLGGLADNNWKIGRNTGSTTKWRYTNNSIDVITANSNLEGFAIGLISGNSYFETGYLGTFIAANVTIGNSSSNSTINSTAFSGSANNTTYVNGKTEGNLNVNSALTSNNSSFLGGTAAASYQLNSTLNANIASYLPTYTGIVNGSSHTVGSSFIANSTGVYHTGTMNAASYTVGTSFTANSTVTNTLSLVVSTNTATIGTGTYFVSNGNVGIGNTSPTHKLRVEGTASVTANLNVEATGELVIAAGAGIYANGGLGSAGEVLHSNGSSVYWAADDNAGGTVTSVATGSGLSGGPITTTGTVSVLANNGITANTTGLFVTQGTGTVVNSSGVHVNSAYIGTLSANNTTYVNGKTEGNLNVNSALTSNNSSFLGGNSASDLRTYSDNKAANAYSNAVSYVDGKSYVNTSQLSSNLSNYQTTAGLAGNVALLAANSATYLGNSSGTIANVSSWITTNAAAAYTNAVSYTDSKILTANAAITGNATTAYTNAVSYTDGKILTANAAITGNAATAYTNAIAFASNASNINTGTLAEARLPFRMNQNLTTSNSVTFGSLTLTGNLTVSGNVTVIGANALSVVDNMIYLNANNTTQNIDVGIVANYNSGAYAHTGIFRDASDGYWKVFDSYLPEPDANVNIDTTNTSFHLADFQANTFYAGNTSTNWFIANTAGVYHTGLVNAASFRVGTSTISNSTGVYTGVVNGSSITIGTAFTANATVVNAVSYYAGSTLIGNTTGPYGKTEGNLNVNNALTSNNSSFLGGTAAASYQLNSTLNANIASYLPTYTGIVNGSSHTVGTSFTANSTVVNAVSYYAGTTLIANSTGPYGKIEGNLNVNNATTAYGKTESNLNVNSALTSNNSTNLGGTAAASYQLNSTLNANIASYLPTYTGVVNGSSHTVGTSFTANATVVNAVSYYAGTTLIGNTTGPYGKTEGSLNVNNATTAYGKTEGNLNVNSATQATNATNLNSQPSSFYTNATNITTGTLPYAQIPANIINTTAAFTISGIHTYNANIVLGSSGLSANGSFGTAGHVLHSNGTATYWAADDNAGGTVTSVASGNGITGGTITTTGTLTAVGGAGLVVNTSGINVLANTGIVANSTGTFVNATYIGTLSANNASFLGGTAAASYQLNSTLSANVATLSANNASFLGGTAAASYQLNSTLGANIASYLPTYTGVVNGSSHTVGTSFTANSTLTNTVSLVVSTNTATIGTGTYFVANGNVGIGTASPVYKLEVSGSFAATTKSFVIDHPSKKGMKLRHGSLEGPENGVYVRGRTNTNIIELPDYWVKLIDKDSITVSLTAIGKTVCPSVGKITNKKINLIGDNIDCFFHVFAERKDVEKLVVEY